MKIFEENFLIKRLKNAEFPPEVISVIETLMDSGYEGYIVGGSLRDILLNDHIPDCDWDIATSAKPDEVMELFEKTIPTGIEHGTVTVLKNEIPIEVTTYRSEGKYTNSRHPDSVEYLTSIRDDLSRRDFTINALAYNPLTDDFVDTCEGARDLFNGVIRCVGDPDERFSEDGLRVLRAIRFATVLEFEIEENTWESIGRNIDSFKKIAMERVRDELNKMIVADKPSMGFEMLLDSSLLTVIMPEMVDTIDCEQNEFHAYDVWGHSLRTLDAAPKDKRDVRWAALFHDIGKPHTRGRRKNGRITFYNHQMVSVKLAKKIMRRLRFSNAEIKHISILIRRHMFNYSSDWTDSAVRRLISRVGRDRIADLFDLRLADWFGNGLNVGFPRYLSELKKRIDRILEEEDALSIEDLEVDGNDVMRILEVEPSEIVGRTLKRLLNMVIEDPKLNKREKLVEILNDMKSEEVYN